LDGSGLADHYPLVRDALSLSDSPTAETRSVQSALTDLPTAEMASLSTYIPQGTQRERIPWPLPIGLTLMDRFQIVAVVESQPEINRYHVIDLKGYLRCWSCHVEHGSATGGDRFCLDCGADMLGHEYLMTERRDTQSDETRPRVAKVTGADTVDSFSLGGRNYVVTIIQPEALLFPSGPHISAAGMSHVGVTRAGDINEDSFASLVINLAQDSRILPLAVAIVADGLGGHANGQEASRLTSRIFVEHLTHELVQPFLLPMGGSLPPGEAVASALREAVATANTSVYEANVQGAADMGSTLVAVMVVGENAWIANVGDSRAYVLDEDGLRRISNDHSLVEQLIVSGMIQPEERYTHSQRNRIFRSLGGDPTVEVDIFTQKLKPGMWLILCSDGLWEMTRDPEIEEILRQADDPRAACEALVVSANNNGGEDNITVVLLRADA
jgi:serine/threonine protein phosphatase PrpC